ncbi:MAG: hypothetical protein IJZ21_03450 [Clostridia bacterium]|nr:hypothetical protein [Clostridia bacterium]
MLDIESKQVLGSVTITEVAILKDEPFEISEIADYDDNNEPIYETETYEAIVQINYTYETIDSSKKITTNNFSVNDAMGDSAEFSPDTEYTEISTSDNKFVVAVKEKGEFINIGFAFHTNQEEIADIKAYYDDSVTKDENEDINDQQVEDINQENTNKDGTSIKLLTAICIMQGISNFVLLVIIIVLLCRRSNHKSKKI